MKLNIYNKLKLNSNNSDIINFILNNNITHSKIKWYFFKCINHYQIHKFKSY